MEKTTSQQSNMLRFSALRLPIVRRPMSAIGLMICIAMLMIVILSVAVNLISSVRDLDTRLLRVATIFQDLLVFILPAIAASFYATRLPASLLTVTVPPRWPAILMTLLVMVASIPAMEFIISLNSSLPLPTSLAQLVRSMEDSSGHAMELLMGEHNMVNMIISILMIGVLTGFSEEIFFRGAMQNLLFTSRMKPHLAIWIIAIIFSFAHFEFYGFIPRMLMGAFFGYLLWWSGSVWVPVIAHIFNNSLAVIESWTTGLSIEALEQRTPITELTPGNYLTIFLSLSATILGLVILRRIALKTSTR